MIALGFASCYNAKKFRSFGGQREYYDGLNHACLHLWFFSIEVFWS